MHHFEEMKNFVVVVDLITLVLKAYRVVNLYLGLNRFYRGFRGLRWIESC